MYTTRPLFLQPLKLKVTKYVSFQELKEIMSKEGVKPYCSKWMKFPLLNHFTGQEVIIAKLSHIDDHILLLHEKSTKVTQNFYSATIKQSDKDKEKKIMQEAARLIKSDILSIPPNKKEFDLSHDLGTASDILGFIPHSLRTFLENIFT
jgi:hypothetical protein